MIPYSYNMVDMGGIDLAEANRTVVPGVYERITEAMNLCGDVILYNWKFAGIEIVPSACSIMQESDSILINGMIQVTELDMITVLGIAPPPASVVPLLANQNGTYVPEPPANGFNPVTVNVDTSIPFFPFVNAYGKNTISVEPRVSLDYTFLALAINGEASTFQNNLSISLNGQQVESTELYYSSHSGSGTQVRNARLIKSNIHCEIGDSVSLSCTNAGRYTMIVLVGIPETDISEVESVITTAGVAAVGEYDSDSICLKGYAQCAEAKLIDDIFEYTAHDVVNSGALAYSYGAGFIFWLN